MKQIISLVILLSFFGCNSSDEPIPDHHQFSVLINGELFIPDRSGTGIYYNDKLKFAAIDSIDKVTNEERFWINFTILNPQIGNNSVDNLSTTSDIYLYRWKGRQGANIPATSGNLVLTEFDTINQTFTGTFNCLFDYPDNDIYYELTNGQFNEFSLSDVFCEPQLDVKRPDSVSLFNNWGLVGFKNPDGNFLYPPCDTESSVQITVDSENRTIARFSGRAPINYFNFQYKIQSNNTFITGAIGTTLAGGSEWDLDYESDFINFLSNDTITFEVADDQLTLTNTTWSSQLIFKTIEGPNPFD